MAFRAGHIGQPSLYRARKLRFASLAYAGRNLASVHSAVPSALPDTVHTYRADIDGLRALAVLPVVFYHAGFRGFGGGYVGVDVFFVISGFLITGIITRELASGTYSLSQFYRRRILRIFPALFLVMALTTAVASIILMPDELIDYASSLAATTLFGSNLLFFNESGYFDAASEAKPLLHTWSLAIEEQFYILWPVILAMAFAIGRGWVRIVVIATCVVSLIAASYMVTQNHSAAFFLLPSRGWELALGGALALIPNRIATRKINDVLALAGVLAILWCCWKYSGQTTFPGLAALPVCIGAALIIYTGAGEGTLVSRLLSIRPAVFVGKISYPLYLWHWPVLVFASNSLVAPPSITRGLICVAIAFFLSVLTWRFVEIPIRNEGRRWSDKSVFAGAAIVMAVAIGCAGALMASDGLAKRYTAEQRSVASYAGVSQDDSYRSGTCFIVDYTQEFKPGQCLGVRGEKPFILLIGNSYAAHLWPGMETLRDRYDIAQATMVGCTPMIYPGNGDNKCQHFFSEMLGQWVPQHKPDVVILAARWLPQNYSLLQNTLTDQRLAGTQIILVGPPPQYKSELPRLLVEADRRGEPDLVRRFLDPSVGTIDKGLRDIASKTGVPYISLNEKLCPEGSCQSWASDRVPLQFDSGHFSAAGSRQVIGLIKDDLDRIIAGTTIKTETGHAPVKAVSSE